MKFAFLISLALQLVTLFPAQAAEFSQGIAIELSAPEQVIYQQGQMARVHGLIRSGEKQMDSAKQLYEQLKSKKIFLQASFPSPEQDISQQIQLILSSDGVAFQYVTPALSEADLNRFSISISSAARGDFALQSAQAKIEAAILRIADKRSALKAELEKVLASIDSKIAANPKIHSESRLSIQVGNQLSGARFTSALVQGYRFSLSSLMPSRIEGEKADLSAQLLRVESGDPKRQFSVNLIVGGSKASEVSGSADTEGGLRVRYLVPIPSDRPLELRAVLADRAKDLFQLSFFEAAVPDRIAPLFEAGYRPGDEDRYRQSEPPVSLGVKDSFGRLDPDSIEVELDGQNILQALSVASADGGYSYRIEGTLISVQEGRHVLVAKAKDFAGNAAIPNPLEAHFTVDRTPPEIHTSVSGQIYSSFILSDFEVQVSDLSPTTTIVRQNGQKVLESSLSTFSVQVPLLEGANHFTFHALDAAGNESLGSPELVAIRDTAAPVIEIGLKGPILLKASLVEIPIYVTDASPVQAVVFINGNELASGTNNFSILAELREGENEIVVLAQDAAGNQGTAESRGIISDTQAPIIHLGLKDTSFTRSSSYPLSVTVEDANGTFTEVRLNGAVIESTQEKIISNTLALVAGMNHVSVLTTDLAGNQVRAEAQVTLDQTPPVLGFSPTDGFRTREQSVQLQIFTNDDSPTTTKLFQSGSQIASTQQKSLSLEVSIAEGGNSFSIHSIDAAGNTSSSTFQLTLDRSNPTLVELVPAAGTQLNSRTFVVSGTASEGLSSATVNNSSLVLSGEKKKFTGVLTVEQNGSLDLAIKVVDLAGNVSQSIVTVIVNEQVPDLVPPPDPAGSAPSLVSIDPTSPLDRFRFLFSGPNPVQTGLDVSKIDRVNFAILRGRIVDKSGTPMSGALVRVLNKPEFGQTVSRNDGNYDLVVAAGTEITLTAAMPGWQEGSHILRPQSSQISFVEDIKLTKLDRNVTAVVFGSSETLQLAESSVIDDSFGQRVSIIAIPAQTSASLLFQNGIEVPISKGSLRVTELSPSAAAPASIRVQPPILEGMSPFAVSFTLDEAVKTEAKGVLFDKPVSAYFKTSQKLPAGVAVRPFYFDELKSEWTEAEHGAVLKILGIQNERALIDVVGMGSAASSEELAAFGILDDELKFLAGRFSLGDSVMRVPLRHFSIYAFFVDAKIRRMQEVLSQWLQWTHNYCAKNAPDWFDRCVKGNCIKDSVGNCATDWCKFQPSAPECQKETWWASDYYQNPYYKSTWTSTGPSAPEVEVGKVRGNKIIETGLSGDPEVDPQNRVLIKSIPVKGTPFSLVYSSARMVGRNQSYVAEVPLTGEIAPAGVEKVLVTYPSWNGYVMREFEAAANLKIEIKWDARSPYGYELEHGVAIPIRIVYYGPCSLRSYDRIVMHDTCASREKSYTLSVGGPYFGGNKSHLNHAGGWTLDIQHNFDWYTGTLDLGDGRRVSTKPGVITTVAGGGTNSDSSRRFDVELDQPQSLRVRRGELAFAEPGRGKVRAVAPRAAIRDLVSDSENSYVYPRSSLRYITGSDGDATFDYSGVEYEKRLNHPYAVTERYLVDRNNVLFGYLDGNVFSPIATGLRTNQGSQFSPKVWRGSITPPPKSTGGEGESFFWAYWAFQSPYGIFKNFFPAIAPMNLEGPISLLEVNSNLYVGSSANCLRIIGGSYMGVGTNSIGASLKGTCKGLPADLGAGVGQRGLTADLNGRIYYGNEDGVYLWDPVKDEAQKYSDVVGSPHYDEANGQLYIVDQINDRIVKKHPDGSEEVVVGCVGNSASCSEENDGNGGYAVNAKLIGPDSAATFQDYYYWGRSLYFAERGRGLIRRVLRDTNQFNEELDSFIIVVPSPDGKEYYKFGLRHLSTHDAITGLPIYTFVPSFGLMDIFDRNGQLTRIEKDEFGRAKTIISSGGVATYLEYNADGFLSKVIDSKNNSYELGYHPNKITNDLRSEGLLSSFRDPRKNEWTYLYDDNGYLAAAADPVSAGGRVILSSISKEKADDSRTLNDVEVTRKTALGREDKFEYLTLPGGSIKHSAVYSDGSWANIVAEPGGRWISTNSDGMRTELEEGIHPYFGVQSPTIQSLKHTFPSGRVLELSEHVTFNANPILSGSQEFPKSSSDRIKRNISGVIAEEALSSLYRDAPPTVTTTLSVNGKSFKETYDTPSRTLTRESAEGRLEGQVLDEYGNVVLQAKHGLPVVRMAYEGGKLIGVKQGKREYKIRYDDRGFVHVVKDPLDHTIQYFRDPIGQVQKVVLQGGPEILFDYDEMGNVTTVKPPERPEHYFAFTPLNFQGIYTAPDIGDSLNVSEWKYSPDRQLLQVVRPENRNIDLVYDSVTGQLKTLKVPTGQTEFSYDGAGRVRQILAPFGENLSYTYDGTLLTSTTWSGPVNGTVSYDYNSELLPAAIGVNGQLVSYTYDNDGLPTQVGPMSLTWDRQSGLLSRTELGGVAENFAYTDESLPDAPFGYGELTSQVTTIKGEQFFKMDIKRDALGRIRKLTQTFRGGVVKVYDYGYDPLGRLVKVYHDGLEEFHFELDANGNKKWVVRGSGEPMPGATATPTPSPTPSTTVSSPVLGLTAEQEAAMSSSESGSGGSGQIYPVSVNARDQIVAYGPFKFSYLSSGELRSREHVPTGGITRYAYDPLGNLRQVDLANGIHITYIIDGENRRVAKKVGDQIVKRFLYDGPRLVAELDGAGNFVSRFVYATKSYAPDYMIKNGRAYRMVPGHRSGPRFTIDSVTGEVVHEMRFDELGAVTYDSNPGFQPFGMAGGIYDPQTKLYRFGARDYDPETGVWTAKDPILFDGGDTNLYRYAGGDPLNNIDPDGLTAEDVQAAVGIASSHFPVLLKTPISYQNLGKGIGGRSELSPILSNRLVLPQEYLGELSCSQKRQLLNTVFHEAQHLTDGYWKSFVDEYLGKRSSIKSISQHHYNIYTRSNDLTGKFSSLLCSGGR